MFTYHSFATTLCCLNTFSHLSCWPCLSFVSLLEIEQIVSDSLVPWTASWERQCVSETRVGYGVRQGFPVSFRNSVGEAYRLQYTYFSNLVARTKLQSQHTYLSVFHVNWIICCMVGKLELLPRLETMLNTAYPWKKALFCSLKLYTLKIHPAAFCGTAWPLHFKFASYTYA